MIKGVTLAHLGPMNDNSEPSDVPCIFPKPVTGHELFFAVSYSKPAPVSIYLISLTTNDSWLIEINEFYTSFVFFLKNFLFSLRFFINFFFHHSSCQE